MTTKPRTTKKPAKATRKPRQPKPTAEDIGRSIGDALGRRLEDLLAKPDLVNRTMLHFSEERGGLDELVNMRGLSPASPLAESPPVSDALDRIAYALKSAEDITQVGHRMLEKYLTPLPPNKDGCGISTCTRGQSDFVRALNEVADRIFADNDARRNILDRLEL